MKSWHICWTHLIWNEKSVIFINNCSNLDSHHEVITATNPEVWPPLINSHSFMQKLTNQKSRTVSSWLLIGLNLHKRMWINQKWSNWPKSWANPAGKTQFGEHVKSILLESGKACFLWQHYHTLFPSLSYSKRNNKEIWNFWPKSWTNPLENQFSDHVK